MIDVLVLVERYDPAAYRKPLDSLGYAFDHRDETHAFFTGSQEGTAVHVHVVEEGDEAARDMLVFRDALRSHPPTAHRYEALKVSLAARLGEHAAYAAAKTTFVRDIVGRAGAGVDP